MHYFLDGYNLSFSLYGHLNTLEEQRKALLSDLLQLLMLVDLNCTIVFDANYQEGNSARCHHHHLEVVYTAEGECADKYILESLERSQNRKLEVVITSDKSLARLAKGLGAHTNSSEQFYIWLKKKASKQSRNHSSRSSLPLDTLDYTQTNLFHYYLQAFEKRLSESDPHDLR